MKIQPLTNQTLKKFEELFCDYYNEMQCDENMPHLFDEFILADWKAELISVALAVEGEPVGFVIYQIDGIENDWCIHEGWGDIRELYVMPSLRKKGLGTQLLKFAEEELKGLPLFVLPDESCEAFFEKNGFSDSGEKESETECKIFVKGI